MSPALEQAFVRALKAIERACHAYADKVGKGG